MQPEALNRPLLSALAVLVCLAGGCDGSGRNPAGDGAPSVPATSSESGGSAEHRVVERGDRYVALGDSYTSLGGDTTHLDASDGCRRSDQNYPHQIAERLDLDLIDNSCGAASTANLTEPQVTSPDGARPPQLDAVTDDTALVTLRIGGNDHRLFAGLVETCTALGRQDPSGSPCTEADAEAATSYAEKIDLVEAALVEAIGEIRERAPRARVIVVSYPQIFPEHGTCPGLPLATGDYAFARAFNEGLVKAQAAAAGQAGAEFVDVFAASEGHDICSDEPWVAGAVPGAAWLSYHPGFDEHAAVAALVVAALERDAPAAQR